MSEEEFRNILNEICVDMNLQVKQQEPSEQSTAGSKRGVGALDSPDPSQMQGSPPTGAPNGRNSVIERQLRNMNRQGEVPK